MSAAKRSESSATGGGPPAREVRTEPLAPDPEISPAARRLARGAAVESGAPAQPGPVPSPRLEAWPTQAAEALRRSEEKYRSIFESAAHLILSVDGAGIIVECNQRAETLLGYVPTEVIGRPMAMLIDPADHAEAEACLKNTLAARGTHKKELRMVRKGGARIVVGVNVAGLRDQTGKHERTVCIVEDITARKQAERDLREQQRLLQDIIEGTDDAIFVKDLEGRYVLINTTEAADFGRTVPEIIGVTDAELFPPQIAQRIREMDRAVISSGRRMTYEQNFERRDGDRRTFSITKYPRRAADGHVIGVIGIARDITNRQQTQRELREQQELIRILMDSIPDTIYLKDLESRFTRVNRAQANLLGLDHPDQAVGRCDADFAPPELAERSRADEQRIIETGEPMIGKTEQGGRAGGELRWFSTTKVPLRDAAGRIIGTAGVSRDITDRKRAEEEREAIIAMLGLINEARSVRDLIDKAIAFFKTWLGCDSVGIRLREGDDYPYYETHGFPAEFVRAENRLCALDASGQPICLADGTPLLECMCGNVIQRRFDPSKPYFTEAGSFWTNSTSELLATTSEDDRLAHTRNRCNTAGYESVGLIRLRFGNANLGLLQFNHRARGLFTRRVIALLERLADYLAIALSQQQVAEALRASEARYARAEQIGHFGHWETDLIGLKTTWSAETYRIFGVDPQRFRPSLDGFLQLIHPSDREAVKTAVDAACAGGDVLDIEFRAVRPDGCERAIHSVAGVHRDDGGRPVRLAGTVLDITARKRAEEASRREKELAEGLVEVAQAIILVLDTEGRIVRFNRYMEELSGFWLDEVRARDWFTTFLPEPDRERARAIFHRAIGGVATHPTVNPIVTKDGRQRLIEWRDKTLNDADGKAVGLLALGQDITERERVAESLRESEQRYRAVIEDLPALLCRFLPDGTITFVSQACCEYFGRTREELIGGSYGQLIPEADRAAVLADLARLNPQSPTLAHEHKLIAPGGEARWQRWTSRARFNAEGKTIAYQAFGQDITETKRAEAEKLRFEARLREAGQMGAVGQLASEVAHDLNNVLTTILGNAELIRAELQPELDRDDPLLVGIAQIEDAGCRAAALTKRLLAIGSRPVDEPTILAPNQLLTHLERMLRHLLHEGIALELHLEPELGHIQCNPGQFEQILLNLAINARDAMPRGGGLTIETANVIADEAFRAAHPELRAGPYVRLTVRDTGCGMDEETRRRAFEPFFTTKPLGHGTGLGLATVRGVVEQAGGCIDLETRPGHGSVFELYFPTADAPTKAGPDPLPTEAAREGSETILLCDDETSVRALASRILEGGGYTVLAASGGAHALQLAREHDGTIHLLVTDIIMPAMSGRELADALRASFPETRVLYTSGYTADALAEQGALEEGSVLLRKPFTLRGLLQTVREILDRDGRPAPGAPGPR